MRASEQFTGFGEPLNKNWVLERCERENLTTFADYLSWETNRLYEHKPGSVLGLKASYGQAMMLMRSMAIPRFFDDVRWVLIQREDLLSQAISFAIADQTKQWHSFDKTDGREPVYDFKDIRRRLQGFANSHMAINLFCSVFQIRPYRVIYDEFARKPLAGAKALAAHLGVKRARFDLSELQMKKQRNRFSDEFRERFLHDYREQLSVGNMSDIGGTDSG
ncbi:MAG: Stf0 family sulfotransferase [Cyanobacteria bacterium P01_F01_bin.3]